MMVPSENMRTSTTVDFPVLEIIQARRSFRAYDRRPIEPEKIQSLFEAARWAPSSMNEQPWTYIYATREQPELYEQIEECLNESNRVWAHKAPLLIVSLFRKKLVRNGLINNSAKYDLGSANAFLTLQATALGLNVHQMGGYNKEKLIEKLGVPADEYEPGVVMAIGYHGDPDTLPEHLKQQELSLRSRHKVSDFVMNRSFKYGNI